MPPSSAGNQRVTFSLRAPKASRVFVAGSFNDWDPRADALIDGQGNGLFTTTLEIPRGEHEYKFVVNDLWTLDPNRPWRSSGQGSANHIHPEPPGPRRNRGRILASLKADPYLDPYQPAIAQRKEHRLATEHRITGGIRSLADFASAHQYYGLHDAGENHWILREWAPYATAMRVFGAFCQWDPHRGHALTRINAKGDWEAEIPKDLLRHHDLYRLHLTWPGGEGDRLPAYARRVVQNEETKGFDAQVWDPDQPFSWRHPRPDTGGDAPLLIYEAHVGIAQEEAKVGTYDEFRRHTLPRIANAGYNAIQLMALMEHPYYGSFGYHVANFFASSSRFGTPEELKELIDEAHRLGLRVIMDLVHSHATKNEIEGLSRFDGTPYQYFHDGPRGDHEAWDSRCFDYHKPEVLHFLLSNCRYWLDEFNIDGFRFDGVTSMLYAHHGLGVSFGDYAPYFDGAVDGDAYAYLALANKLIHEIHPQATTIAEDVSGMPGLGASLDEGGCGFDARMAMGIPDHWFRLTDIPDEDWNVEQLWHELTNRRQDERTISYVESHDQALVGGQGFLFQMIGAAIYDGMARDSQNTMVDRGVALHKLARLLTLATSDAGYLTFMGNEFGHPEWIDFPREGNDWSYHYARRQWSLRDNADLRYHGLAEFDRAMLEHLGNHRALDQPPELLYTHESDQVLAFSRGSLTFIFNFHPTQSHADYRIPVRPGSHTLIFDSDAAEFAGHDRVAPEQNFHPKGGAILTYLPTRTALVLLWEATQR